MNTIEITPGTVVAAVDGSDHAHRAVQWAASQARLEGRSLSLVHAVGHETVAPATLPTTAGQNVPPLDDSMRMSHLILEKATEYALAIAPEVSVRGISVPGDPRQALPEVSRSAHLLVLGSRGRGVVRSRLLGSVSAAVAKSTHCPVVVVRPNEPGRLKDGVIVAADATPESLPVVEFAFAQASAHGVPLTILHCVQDVAVVATGRAGGYVHVLPTVGEHARLLAESIAGLSEKYPDVHVSREMRNGRVEVCLAAHPRPWNLVVLGRHPVHGLGWLTGSTAVDVMERSTSPIAVVPEAAAVS